MISAVRRIQFCSGHRIYGHENKCGVAHGHNYVAYFHATQVMNGLDSIGRVVDFSVLKEAMGAWIDANWDHKFLVWDQDHDMIKALESIDQLMFKLPENPTAENMAWFLLKRSRELLPPDIELNKVVLWETENCFVEVMPI